MSRFFAKLCGPSVAQEMKRTLEEVLREQFSSLNVAKAPSKAINEQADWEYRQALITFIKTATQNIKLSELSPEKQKVIVLFLAHAIMHKLLMCKEPLEAKVLDSLPDYDKTIFEKFETDKTQKTSRAFDETDLKDKLANLLENKPFQAEVNGKLQLTLPLYDEKQKALNRSAKRSNLRVDVSNSDIDPSKIPPSTEPLPTDPYSTPVKTKPF